MNELCSKEAKYWCCCCVVCIIIETIQSDMFVNNDCETSDHTFNLKITNKSHALHIHVLRIVDIY